MDMTHLLKLRSGLRTPKFLAARKIVRQIVIIFHAINYCIENSKAMTRLNRAIEKLSSAREIEQNKGFRKGNNSCLRPVGFEPNEEVKGIDFDNLDSSLDLGSHKSVSDSEESKKEEALSVETTLYNALFCHSKHPRKSLPSVTKTTI